MPDPIAILLASIAATVAAFILTMGSRLGFRGKEALSSAGTAIAVGLGFFAGAWMLGVRPQVPPREGLERLFVILLPSVVLVEVAAAWMGNGWRVWLLRLPVALAAARTLLHGSIYLVDLAGPNSREWTSEQSWLVLSVLAALLVAVWALLVRPVSPATGRSSVFQLCVTSFACTLVIMMSGYASAGQLGLPLAGALAGVWVASWFGVQPPRLDGAASVGIVSVFGLLVLGRYFGSVTDLNALLLLFAPLVGQSADILVARSKTATRIAVSTTATILPLALALFLAQQKFAADMQPQGADPKANQSAVSDYMNYGK